MLFGYSFQIEEEGESVGWWELGGWLWGLGGWWREVGGGKVSGWVGGWWLIVGGSWMLGGCKVR